VNPAVDGHEKAAGVPHAMRILGNRWQEMVRNTTVTEATGLPSVGDIIKTRRSALFTSR